MLSQLHAANFGRIFIDVQVQVLRDRAVAKLVKLLSRWRTTVIQDSAEFCIWWIGFYPPTQILMFYRLKYEARSVREARRPPMTNALALWASVQYRTAFRQAHARSSRSIRPLACISKKGNIS